MEFAAGSYILFDCTRLLLGALNDTPTGIDRVEMAYARHLQTHYPQRTRYLVSVSGRPKVVPSAAVKRFMRATNATWSDTTAGTSAKQLGKLCRFLNVPEALLSDGNVRENVYVARKMRRRMAGASMLLHAVAEHARPRNLWGFSRHNRNSIYVNVSHESIDSRHVRYWLERGGSTASTFLVHDLIPITHPEYVRPGAPARHEQRLHTVAQCTSSVIVNSSYTGDVLRNYMESQGHAVPEILTAPLGVEDVFLERQKVATEIPPYFVCVGTIEPRKNHMLLLQVWRRLVAELGESAPKLVLIGRRGWENENAVDLIERSKDIQGHILECTGLPDQMLARLITHARATLFPSHVEGYGLPVAESLALGTPAICSDIDATRELAGDMVERIDPLDGLGWKQAIMEYARPGSLRWQAQRSRVSHYRAPRWNDHLSVFDRMIENTAAGWIAA